MSLARPSLPLAPFALLVAPLAVSLARPTLAQEKDGAPLRLAPVLFDDFKSAAPQDPAFLAEAAARDAADLAACQHVPRPAGQPSPKSTTTAAALRASLDAQVVYDAVHGDVWAAGAGWKARFGADGVEYVPRLGKAAPQNFPTRFDLARVTVGGAELALRTPHVARTADGVALDHGSVREIYHVAPEFLEQTFVFDTLPAAADIVVDIAVESAWAVVPGADLIRFVHPTWGEVTYGRAYVLDAAGARAEIHREWTGDGIRLVVPASFVAGAVLPLTIDPIIGGSLMNNQGTVDDDSNVDVAWDQSSQQLWFVWQDYTSATDADIFVASFDAAGTIAAALAIDLSADYWETPAIAASPTTQRVMVVASATIDGPGTSVADITGRIVDTATRSLGGQFVVDTQSQNCVRPDVGGSWDTLVNTADFCVVYEREFSPTDHDILARVVNPDGTFLTTVISLSNSSSDNDFAPAISKSRGDESLTGDYWNVAWIRDTDGDGRGTPMTQRLYYNGTTNGSVEQAVFATQLASRVDVSSTFDDPVHGTNERPYVVVFERTVGNGDIYATVCAQNAVYGTSNVSVMEDFDSSLVAGDASVATDGTSFFIIYDELFFGAGPGGTDYDVHAVSGGLWSYAGAAGVALAERHRYVGTTVDREMTPVVTSFWDGGSGLLDDAWMAWVQLAGPLGGSLWFQRYDSATTEGSELQAIGVQYCVANGHADSYADGRASSFISARGNASTGSIQQLWCEEMKQNAFAYFIVSTAAGNVNLAGGGAGRLCLGGAIGRVVGGSILLTGSTGAVVATFDPASLPSPTGPFAAAPGQSLYFQCWHRDTTAGGTPTSNFSNGCVITFRP